MAEIKAGQIIGIVVSLILIGILLPIGLSSILNPSNWAFNETTSIFDLVPSGNLLSTLIFTLIPVMIIIGIAMKYVRDSSD
jgi:hypothetical protein